MAGAGKTTTCIKLADRLLARDPDLTIASLGLSLRTNVGTCWNRRPWVLAPFFPGGFSDGVVNGWVMMGSFVSVCLVFILQW